MIARLLVLFCLCLPVCAQQAAARSETLDNEAIVTMVKAGLSDEIVLAKISSSPASFDTSAQALADLKKEGVSDRVIMAIFEAANPHLRQARPAPQALPRQTPRPTQAPYATSASSYDDEVTERGIVYGGLAYSRGDVHEDFLGWNTAVTVRLAERLAVKGDFSGVYADVNNGLVDYALYSFAVGPEFRNHWKKASLFGHTLVGLSRTGSGLNFLNTGENNIEYIFGGGLDVWLTDRFGVRPIQADYQLIRAAGESINMARISAGAVFRF